MLCGTCRENDARDGQRTCKACHARYMQRWRPNQMAKAQQKAYKRGVDALAGVLDQVFMTIGAGEMNGYTAVQIVKNSLSKVPRETFT